MAGMEYLGIDRWYNVDGKIVRADDADLLVGKPPRALKTDARGTVIECAGFGMPTRPVPGPHEDRVTRSD